MRFPKPFFRAAKNAWYVQLGKRQISLGPDRDEAFVRYRRLLLEETGETPQPATDYTVAELLDLYLDHSQASHDPETYEWYRNFLSAFCRACGRLKVADLKPFNVSNWMLKKSWNDTTKNKAIGILKRSLNWAVEEGLLSENPLRTMKKPTAKRREVVVTPEQRRQIMAAVRDRAFKQFLTAMSQTGARPGEIASVTAQDVDLDVGVWVIHKHKTAKKTGRPRIIYLTDEMKEMCCDLTARFPEGPIFRNVRGAKWTRNAIRIRFRRLRAKLNLPEGTVAYCFRHAYVTEALERGIPDATVAELVGHASTEMIHRCYSHLSQCHAHLAAAAANAVK